SKRIVSLNHKWLTQNKLANEKKMQKLVRAVRGTRTYGRATRELMLLAEGATDDYLSMRLSPCDLGAGKIILHEVGGVLKKISGNALEMLDTAPVIAGNQHLVETVIQNYLQD